MTFNYFQCINSNCLSGWALRSEWQQLRVESCVLRELGLAAGTWANKVSHLRGYIKFTIYFQVPDFPVKLGVLLRFIAILGRGPYAYKSALNIISSIKFFASLLDPPSVKVFDAVLVSASLKGLKAQLSRPVRQKLPITVKHLLSFYGILDITSVNHLACWCAMLLSFFGCLRLSNMVPSSVCNFDPLKQLKRDDIRFVKECIFVYFKWSKTNQNSGKVSWFPIFPVNDSRFNLKCHLELLFDIVKAPVNAPLFTFGKNKFHTRNTLVKLLEMCVTKAGLSSSNYSWHSFRRGAATFAFELGLADTEVQLLGDWSSSAFLNYLEFSFDRRLDVAEQMSKSFDVYVSRG